MNYFSALTKILAHPANKDNAIGTIGRLMWWKMNQVFFKLPAVYQLTDSTKIICEPSSSYGSFVIYARYPEFEEMQFIHSYLKKDNVFIDVGANIGAVTLVAADKIARGRIYAFEPTPAIADKCTTNIRLNKLEKRVTCFTTAVSNKNGTLQFAIEPDSEVNHIATNDQRRGSSVITVETITLDTFAAEHNIDHIQMLKVDVEGAELSVFQGATRLLHEQRIDVIVFEVNAKMSQFGSAPAKLFSYLKKCKYKLFTFGQDGQLVKFKENDYIQETINLVAVSPAASSNKRWLDFVK
jgi:FkbM family methyltransferase